MMCILITKTGWMKSVDVAFPDEPVYIYLTDLVPSNTAAWDYHPSRRAGQTICFHPGNEEQDGTPILREDG